MPGEPTRVMAEAGLVSMCMTSRSHAVGMAAVVPAGLISLAVTTRYLEPVQFRQSRRPLGARVDRHAASGLAFLQGTIMTAYGVGDDEGDIDGAGLTRVVASPTKVTRRLWWGSSGGGSWAWDCSRSRSRERSSADSWPRSPNRSRGPSSAAPTSRGRCAGWPSAWTGSMWRMVDEVFRRSGGQRSGRSSSGSARSPRSRCRSRRLQPGWASMAS